MNIVEERLKSPRPPLERLTITLDSREINYIQKYAIQTENPKYEFSWSGSSTLNDLILAIKRVVL